jgi:hypothetical protein
MSDNVNHPSHYTGGSIECIDAIKEATCDLRGIMAICTGNAIKYLWRWHRKNGTEDLKKARWYINRLIYEIESGDKAKLLRLLHSDRMELDATVEQLTEQVRKEEPELDKEW